MIYPGVSGRSSLLLPSITREGADPTSSVHNTFRAWLVLEACCFHTIENQDCFSLKKKKNAILRKGPLDFLVEETFHIPGSGYTGSLEPHGMCAVLGPRLETLVPG